MINLVDTFDKLRQQLRDSSIPELANMSEEEENRLYQASLARFLRQQGQA